MAHGLAAGFGQVARNRERHVPHRAEAEWTLLTAAFQYEEPRTATGTVDLQIEAATVAVPAAPATHSAMPSPDAP